MINNLGVQKTVSLVIATYNGESTLPVTLNSINQLELPEAWRFNFLIINNNSTDKTEEILENFKINCSYHKLYQNKQGKNAALNTIFEHENLLGDLLIFTDDDVILPKDFVKRYCECVELNQNFDVFGGKIEPFFTVKPPENLLEGIDAVVAYAITPKEYGYKAGGIDPIKLHGPNMAIKKSVFGTLIRFDESIGPNGSDYVMGSETELLYRLRKKGFTAYFDDLNTVKHIIQPVQVTKIWLAKRAFKAGRSFYMHEINSFGSLDYPTLFGYPRWAAFKVFKLIVRNLFFGGKDVDDYRRSWEINHLKGFCHEYKKKEDEV